MEYNGSTPVSGRSLVVPVWLVGCSCLACRFVSFECVVLLPSARSLIPPYSGHGSGDKKPKEEIPVCILANVYEAYANRADRDFPSWSA